MERLKFFIFILFSLNIFSYEQLKGIGERKCEVATKKGVRNPQFPTYKMNCETFEHIIGSWYKDNENVYYYKDQNSMYIGFEVIENINPEKVKPIGESMGVYYISDEKNIYIQEGYHIQGMIENVDIKTFKVLENGYSKDKKSVYFSVVKVKGAATKTFKVLENGYAKDKNNVYYFGREIRGADPKTFIINGERIRNEEGIIYDSEDKNNTYDMGVRRPRIDFSTFKELGSHYSKDKKSVYYGDKYVEGADSLSFEEIGGCCGRDKHNIYCYGRKMRNVDYPSFQILSNEYQKDKSNIYYYEEKIENGDPKTFVAYIEVKKTNDNINYNAEDKNNYYLAGEVVKKKINAKELE